METAQVILFYFPLSHDVVREGLRGIDINASSSTASHTALIQSLATRKRRTMRASCTILVFTDRMDLLPFGKDP